MKFIQNILSRAKVKKARKAVAIAPSPRSYAALAEEYARRGMAQNAAEVCEEGLGIFASNTLLTRLLDRARRVVREERMAVLRRELVEAPRPALWSEMCDILLELGQVGRAETYAREWVDAENSGEARLMLARVRTERFIADRGRGLGFSALEALDEAVDLLKGDARPLRLKLIFLMKIGAWGEARTTAAKLLELEPGAPELESRFRKLEDLSAGAPSIERALMDVEKSGRMADESSEVPQATASVIQSVRPVLRELARDSDVEAALYVRGSTVLIQGPKGATADRTARSVRSIINCGRTAARRMGLGQIFQVQLEGEFGQLTIAPGEADAGVVWSRGELGRQREEILHSLSGLQATSKKTEL